MFVPTKRVTVGDDILKQFIDMLSSGKYKPGQKLPSERSLCETFKISRPALREVIRALTYLGYFDSVQGGGTYVSKMPLNSPLSQIKLRFSLEKKQLMEALELRYILEVEMAGLAAQRATPEDVDQIEEALRKYESEALADNDPAQIIAATNAFHNRIAKAAYNDILMNVFDAISDLLTLMREKTIQVQGSTLRSLKDHRDIVAAIKSKDPAKAKEMMKNHLLDVQSDMESYFRTED